jgi:hypothetical protein
MIVWKNKYKVMGGKISTFYIEGEKYG